MEGKGRRTPLALRAIILVSTLGVLFVQTSERLYAGEFPGPSGLAMWFVAAGLALYAMAYITGASRSPVALLALDFGLVVSLVALTGGVLSVFVPLYFGVILASAFQVRPNAAPIAALLASTFQTAIWGGYDYAQATGLDPMWGAVNPIYVRSSRGEVFWLDVGVLLAQHLGFYTIGALGCYLAWRQRQERELHREILARLADGVVSLDVDGRVLYANDRARHLLGLPYDLPIADQPLSMLVPPSNREAARILDERREASIELDLDNNYGDPVPVLLQTRMLTDARGRPRGVTGVLVELTVHRQLELALQRAERLEATSDLSAYIAHELRNPLASIRGCAQEIGRVASLGEAEREMTRIVMGESDRLDRIIGEFLQFARLPAPRLEPVDAHASLVEAKVLLARRQEGASPAARRPVELRSTPGLLIRADRGQLTQLLLNLGLNALAASPPGAPVVLVARRHPVLRAVRHARADATERAESIDGVRIEVQDQGPGIPSEVLDRLFDPFFTTKQPGQGSGLGLAIASRIVGEHAGAIRVTSEPGKTTFVVWLPKDPAEAADLRVVL